MSLIVFIIMSIATTVAAQEVNISKSALTNAYNHMANLHSACVIQLGAEKEVSANLKKQLIKSTQEKEDNKDTDFIVPTPSAPPSEN